MITKKEILNKLSELKPMLYKDYAVKEIGLFGSFSDNSFSEDSDIDILVELERPIGWKFFSLEIFLENTFGRKIDLVTKNALKDQIKESILKQVNYVQVKKEDRTYQLYLEDIQTAMSRIAEYIDGYDFNRFKKDYKTVDAVIRNFEIIGEASKNLPEVVKLKYPEMPWQEMYYLRNKISHEYFGIDYEIIWDVATNYLPDNSVQIKKIIEKEKR